MKRDAQGPVEFWKCAGGGGVVQSTCLLAEELKAMWLAPPGLGSQFPGLQFLPLGMVFPLWDSICRGLQLLHILRGS